MNFKIRVALAASILFPALTALLAWGRFGSGRAHARTGGWENAQCRECHTAAWQQWEDSYHARAWSDMAVQATFQHFGFDRKCQSCHAPEPVLITGLAEPVALREEGRERGVDCLSCHALPDGAGVAATRTIATAPCRPIARPELATSQVCSTCHDAIYKDWVESRYQAEGKTCQTCHMPKTEAGGSNHLCLGGHDDALVRSGAKLAYRQEKEVLHVSVTNHATGHNFPGERHNRVLLVQVIERDAAGNITLANQQTIKAVTPFRGETTAERIRVDQTFEAQFPVVAPAVDAHVQLLYKRFPWQRDRDALVVHEARVPLTAP